MKRLLAICCAGLFTAVCFLGPANEALAHPKAQLVIDPHTITRIHLAGCRAISPTIAVCTSTKVEFTGVTLSREPGLLPTDRVSSE